MTEKIKYYFVTYWWKSTGPTQYKGWTPEEALTDQHPAEWLINARNNNNSFPSGNLQYEYHLNNWHEITEDQYNKWKEWFG